MGRWGTAVKSVIRRVAGRIHHRRAHRRRLAGNLPGAVSSYQTACAWDDGQPLWWVDLAEAQIRAGDPAGAVHAYEAAIALAGTQPRWHVELAKLRRKTGDPAGAVHAYEAAIALDDRKPRWHEELGLVRELSGDAEGGVRAYKSALARDQSANELDYKLLSLNAWRFPPRRLVARFISANLEEIREHSREIAERALPADPRVYLFWAQGIEAAPPIVKLCHRQLMATHGVAEVVVLDREGASDLIHLSPEVLRKTEGNHTKFSDLLRLAVLARHGGIWVDATCLVRTRVLDLLSTLLRNSFFAFQYERSRISTWFLASHPGGYIPSMWLAAQCRYWEGWDGPRDYYFPHHIFQSLYCLDRRFQGEWDASFKLSAYPPHALKRVQLEPCSPDRFQVLLDHSFVHKLTYKYREENVRADTLLAHLLHGSGVAPRQSSEWRVVADEPTRITAD